MEPSVAPSSWLPSPIRTNPPRRISAPPPGSESRPAARSRAISNLFLPPEGSAGWVALKAEQRRLSGVRLMECAHPGEEAQAIALLIRQALEVPERRAALITPDRGLAARVVAHLRRWNVMADDTAGLPLPQLVLAIISGVAAAVGMVSYYAIPYVVAGRSAGPWSSAVAGAIGGGSCYAFTLAIVGGHAPRRGPETGSG